MMEVENAVQHMTFDHGYVGMGAKRLHEILKSGLNRQLILYCGRDRKNRWLLKEIAYILDGNFNVADSCFKNATGTYELLMLE